MHCCFGGVERQVVPWRHTVRGSLLTCGLNMKDAPEAIDNRGVGLAWHSQIPISLTILILSAGMLNRDTKNSLNDAS